MTSSGIVAFSGYIPRLRLKRASVVDANRWMNPALAAFSAGHRSMVNWDEDSITMAVAAARSAIADHDPALVGSVTLASTTLPFADRSNSGIVAAALNLAESIETLDVTSSQRVSTSALIASFKGLADGRTSLVVAADHRLARPGSARELSIGDGAAALLLGSQDIVASFLGSHSMARDFVDHYRGEGEDADYVLEERWVREEGYLKMVPQSVQALLDRLQIGAETIDHFILPSIVPKIAAAVAKSIGIKSAAVTDNMADECGDTGAAHPLLMLAKTLETALPGSRILVVGFGQGVDTLLFEMTDTLKTTRQPLNASLARGREETSYTKFLSFNNLLKMDWGIRAERDNRTAHSVAYRKRDGLTRFIGGKCRVCGTVQFPKTLVCVNPECHAVESQDDQRFADMPGRIKTFTEDWQAFTPAPPLPYGNIAFEAGGNIFMELTDCPAGSLSIGMSVDMVFRIKDIDEKRGFRRYFWKAAPRDL